MKQRKPTFILHENGEDKFDLIMSDDLTGSATGFTFDKDQLHNLVSSLVNTTEMQTIMDELYKEVFGNNVNCYHYPQLKQLVQLYGSHLLQNRLV